MADRSDPTKELHPAFGVKVQTQRVDAALRKQIRKTQLLTQAMKRKRATMSRVDRIRFQQKRRMEVEEKVMKFLKEMEDTTTRVDTKKFVQMLGRVRNEMEIVWREENRIMEDLIKIQKDREEDLELTEQMRQVVLDQTIRLGKSGAVYWGQSELNVFSARFTALDEVKVLKTKQPTKHE